MRDEDAAITLFRVLSGGALVAFAVAGLGAPVLGYAVPVILEVTGLLVAVVVGLALLFDRW